jgi:hypothetical protein
MSPPREEAFEQLFRGLSPDRRMAFVAGLWSARGWAVERRDGDLVAKKQGAERRIRVVAPGRLRTPAVDSADVVVPSRDSPALREATGDADADYVPPAALRERLLYGVDREAAVALFETTFGQPLDSPNPHVSPPLSRRLRSGVKNTLAVGDARLPTAGLLLVLLAGAVLGGPALAPTEEFAGVQDADSGATVPVTDAEAAGEGGETTGTATVATADQSYFPPGVNNAGIHDLSTLLAAHREGVARRQRTLRIRASGPPNATAMDGRREWNYTTRIEQHFRYRVDAQYRLPEHGENESVRIAVYANGGTNYRRVVDRSGVTYHRYPTEAAGFASDYTDEVIRYLEVFLAGQNSTGECIGEWTATCRVTVTGAPAALPGSVADYRATVSIQHNGIVSWLAVSYTLPDTDGDGVREQVRFALEYQALDRTTVEDPAWLDTARNETAG